MAKKVQIERNREFILILLRCSLSWGAKVQIKSEKLTPFGGIFQIMEQFNIILGKTIDSTLGLRCSSFGYQYSEIIRSLMCVYFCGGSCMPMPGCSKHTPDDYGHLTDCNSVLPQAALWGNGKLCAVRMI